MKAWQTTLTQLIVSATLSYLGYWYTLAAPALILGVLDRGESRSVWVGLASALGVLSAILAHPEGLTQAALVAEIVGVPGAQTLPLAVTLLYPFALGFLGKLAGSSLTSRKGGVSGA